MIKLILLALLCVTGSPPKADFLVAASSQQPSYHSDGGGGRAGSTDLRGLGPHSLPVGRGFQPDFPTLSEPDTLGDSLSCLSAYAYGRDANSAGLYQIAKDTLKSYIEHCYAQPNSWNGFVELTSAVSGIAQQSECLPFREWLFKVLYYNPDTLYYCEDVGGLLSTFAYYGPRGTDLRGEMAVERFIADSGKCPYLTSYMHNRIQGQWNMVYTKWKDTVTNAALTPFDSIIPSLQEIGFERLYGPQFGSVQSSPHFSSVFGAITSSPNPFGTEANIRYVLNESAMLTVEVFDALGKKVCGLVHSSLTPEGDHIIQIPGASLSSGTYYVRFSVPYGEVRTLKVTKQ